VFAKLKNNIPAMAGLFGASATWILPLLAFLSVIQVTRKPREITRCVYVWGAFLFSLMLCTTVLISRDLIRANDLFPAFTFFILAAIVGIYSSPQDRTEEANKRKAPLLRQVVSGVFVLLIVTFAFSSFSDSFALARPDTRERARSWCRKNLPANCLVLRERYTIRIGRKDIHEISRRYLASSAARDAILAGQPDFLLTSSLAYDRFFDTASPYHDLKAQALYQYIQDNYQSVISFQDRELPFAHPRITIYAKADSAPKNITSAEK
jgi:hypothetical protein